MPPFANLYVNYPFSAYIIAIYAACLNVQNECEELILSTGDISVNLRINSRGFICKNEFLGGDLLPGGLTLGVSLKMKNAIQSLFSNVN